MKKVLIILILCFWVNNVMSQENYLDTRPPVWNNDRIQNRTSFLFPFKESNAFIEAVVYFERIERNNSLILRYRVISNYPKERLYMQDTPEMLLKIGDGTTLRGKKERVLDGMVNFNYVFDVYFVLDQNLAQKILTHGIEKARIAYVYNFGGLNENQIFDAFTKDSELTEFSIQDLLKQILDANIQEVRNESLKNSLDYGF